MENVHSPPKLYLFRIFILFKYLFHKIFIDLKSLLKVFNKFFHTIILFLHDVIRIFTVFKRTYGTLGSGVNSTNGGRNSK